MSKNKISAICGNSRCDFELELDVEGKNKIVTARCLAKNESTRQEDFYSTLFNSDYPLPKACPWCASYLVYLCPSCGYKIDEPVSKFCMNCLISLKQTEQPEN